MPSDTARPARRHPHVVNLRETELLASEHGSRFAGKARQLGKATGARHVGCNWFEVPPGRTGFPFHYHCATEEAIFVLEGTGTLRLGDQEIAVGAGDFASFPLGPDHPHQLINTGEMPLRYLCFSNRVTADVVGYPDSDKIGALAVPALDASDTPWVRAIFRASAQVPYYDGELPEGDDSGNG